MSSGDTVIIPPLILTSDLMMKFRKKAWFGYGEKIVNDSKKYRARDIGRVLAKWAQDINPRRFTGIDRDIFDSLKPLNNEEEIRKKFNRKIIGWFHIKLEQLQFYLGRKGWFGRFGLKFQGLGAYAHEAHQKIAQDILGAYQAGELTASKPIEKLAFELTPQAIDKTRITPCYLDLKEGSAFKDEFVKKYGALSKILAFLDSNQELLGHMVVEQSPKATVWMVKHLSVQDKPELYERMAQSLHQLGVEDESLKEISYPLKRLTPEQIVWLGNSGKCPRVYYTQSFQTQAASSINDRIVLLSAKLHSQIALSEEEKAGILQFAQDSNYCFSDFIDPNSMTATMPRLSS